jgi:hypothetical protein
VIFLDFWFKVKRGERFSPLLPQPFWLQVLLAQQAGNFGDNAIPDAGDGTLVQCHEHSAHHYNNQYDNEPAGHLVAGLAFKKSSGV